VQRKLVYIVITLLVVVGSCLVLSFTAGGVVFALGCFAAALALWLLYRGVMALELSANLLAQGLLQRNKLTREATETKDDADATARGPEAVREEPRLSQPVAAGDYRARV
jgi:multisubunit Na+/H+ antiporter MnhC subunit